MTAPLVAVNSDAPGDPLYVRVALALRHRILVGDAFSPGDAIPPERVLVRDFGVSRITLRRAIDLLVDEHLLVRRRGIGTFVASPRVPYPLVGLHSTRDIARAHGLTPEVRILDYETGGATAMEREKLELSKGLSVIRFIRQDLLEAQPVSIAECVLPAQFSDALNEDQLREHSTYELIEQRSPVRISSARQRLFAASATARVSSLLRVPTDYPVFVIDRITNDVEGQPVEWGRISYPNKNIECLVELFRESANRNERAVGFALRFLPTKGDDSG